MAIAVFIAASVSQILSWAEIADDCSNARHAIGNDGIIYVQCTGVGVSRLAEAEDPLQTPTPDAPYHAEPGQFVYRETARIAGVGAKIETPIEFSSKEVALAVDAGAVLAGYELDGGRAYCRYNYANAARREASNGLFRGNREFGVAIPESACFIDRDIDGFIDMVHYRKPGGDRTMKIDVEPTAYHITRIETAPPSIDGAANAPLSQTIYFSHLDGDAAIFTFQRIADGFKKTTIGGRPGYKQRIAEPVKAPPRQFRVPLVNGAGVARIDGVEIHVLARKSDGIDFRVRGKLNKWYAAWPTIEDAADGAAFFLSDK